MSQLSNLIFKHFFRNTERLAKPTTNLIEFCRTATKLSSRVTRNAGNSRPKHRGWQRQDGHIVQQGTILVKQNNTRFHPGLNVGIGKNGYLYAMYSGKVFVTCERADLDWKVKWVRRNYRDRQGQTFYKKYYNIITEPEHKRFKLTDTI